MSYFESVQATLKKYADFKGRASPREFWCFVGFVVVAQALAGLVGLLLLRSGPVTDRKSLNRIIGTFYLDWPYAAHWRRDLYRIPAANVTVTGLVFCGLQKLRDMLDEKNGLV